MIKHRCSGKVAVIFDFDGTLVDSYTHRGSAHLVVRDLLLDYVAQKGYESRRAKMLRLISGVEEEMTLKREYNRTVWFLEVLRRYTGEKGKFSSKVPAKATLAYWNSIVVNSFLYPRVEEILSSLKKNGLLVGLLSDTDGLKGMKTKRITRSGLGKFFDAVVIAGEDTREVKPQKQPFSKISKLLGVSTKDCVYVGDDPNVDVAGAKELAMKTVIIRNPRASFHRILTLPDYILKRERFGEIEGLIGQFIRKGTTKAA